VNKKALLKLASRSALFNTMQLVLCLVVLPGIMQLLDIGIWPQFLVVLTAYIVTEIISFKMILKNVDEVMASTEVSKQEEES